MNSFFVLVPRILQLTALVADVPDVFVSGIDFFCCLFNWNVVLMSIFDEIFTGLEIPGSPWGDDLHRRIDGLNRGFESDLIVALSGAAVADDECALFYGEFHELLRHQRPRHRSSEEIISFVDCSCLQGRVNVVSDKFFSDVDRNSLRCAGRDRLLFYCIEVFSLAGVAAGSDHFVIEFFDQPFENNGCVQPAGVGKDDFFFRHIGFLLRIF